MIDDVLHNRKTWHIEVGDCIEVMRRLPDGCVQCCVTSPPYWGLRDYGVEGQFGLEPTPELYIAHAVEIFREVKRILRPDGTLWLNIGDSYCNAGSRNNGTGLGGGRRGGVSDTDGSWADAKANYGDIRHTLREFGIKHKDLVGIPWQLAFALRADGWYLRSEIIWHKKAPMPESVTDRPTKAHEQVFLLAKSSRYFYDNIAASEAAVYPNEQLGIVRGLKVRAEAMGRAPSGNEKPGADAHYGENRNMRTVWTLGPESFSGAHFATMPTELARRCLLTGTSEKGCCERCGTPWRRTVLKSRRATREPVTSKLGGNDSAVVGNRDPYRHCTVTTTTGWEPGCQCDQGSIPCLVFDPFAGAGTTLLVAQQLGLRALGSELNPEYAEMAGVRIRNRNSLPGTKPAKGQIEMFGEPA